MALTATLIGMAWVDRRRTVEAMSEFNRSEGEGVMQSIREAFRDLSLPPGRPELETILALHEPDGLKSIGFFDSDDRLIAQAGSSLSPDHGLAQSTGSVLPQVLNRAGRIRMLGFFRPTQESPGAGLRWASADSPGSATARSVVAIEVEPLLARVLLVDADRIFTLAALTGAALVAVTLMFWRVSERQERARQQTEQEGRLGLLGEMSAVLAHEIRNPLASLKGNAQLLAGRQVPGSGDSKRADRVVAEAERLEGLTADLLEFARTGPVDIRPADPVGLLEACIEEVAGDGFEVQSASAPRSWPLDARRVRQAVVNVLRNALQASPAGTRPQVTLSQEAANLVFAVHDFGAGIRPGEEERVFTPFFTTRITGTGLGLAVARRIAELHGGTVVACNQPQGALFRIILAAQTPLDHRRSRPPS